MSLRHRSSSALSTAFGRCCSGSRLAAKFATLAVEEEDASPEPRALLAAAARVLGDTCAGSSDHGGGWTCLRAKAASLSSFRSCFCNRFLSSFSKYGRSSSNSSYDSLISVGPPAQGDARGVFFGLASACGASSVDARAARLALSCKALATTSF